MLRHRSENAVNYMKVQCKYMVHSLCFDNLATTNLCQNFLYFQLRFERYLEMPQLSGNRWPVLPFLRINQNILQSLLNCGFGLFHISYPFQCIFVLIFGFFGARDDDLFGQFIIVYNLSINHCLSEVLYLCNQYSGSFYYTNLKIKQSLENCQTLDWFQHKWYIFFFTVLVAYNISCFEKFFSSGKRAEVIHTSICENLSSLSHQYLLMDHHSNN